MSQEIAQSLHIPGQEMVESVILPVFCTNLSLNAEIEFNAGSHDETIRMRFDDYKRLANPKMVHFAKPYSGVPRLAA